jgi:hypothetical protein
MRDQTFLDAYANQLRLSASLSDVTIVFGVNDEVGPSQTVVRDRMAVRLSMPTAKALELNLRTIIEAYEATVSEIRVPASTTQALEGLLEAIKSNLILQLKSTEPEKSDS